MYIESALYVVATPIGNLGDITLRAIDVLKGVDLIAAEDTRHTQKLLVHLGIKGKLISIHEHNEREKAQSIIEKIQLGKSIALVSDAGTPLISDPGFHLVKIARQSEVKVVPVPGVSALITALSVSGMASDRFVFEGFLPAKNVAKKKALIDLETETRTLIFYESPHRILATLEQISEVFGADRLVVLARELTKNFETILSLPVSELLNQVKNDPYQQKGEFVLLVKGQNADEKKFSSALNADVQSCLESLMEELPIKKAVSMTAKLTGLPKKELYQMALKVQGKIP